MNEISSDRMAVKDFDQIIHKWTNDAKRHQSKEKNRNKNNNIVADCRHKEKKNFVSNK